MTEQLTQQWSNEQIQRDMFNCHAPRGHYRDDTQYIDLENATSIATGYVKRVVAELTTQLVQVKAEREDMRRERDKLQQALDAIMGYNSPYLDNLTETELERYSQLSPPEMFKLLRKCENELVAVLDVAISRGTEWGYSDDDYQARYQELTGEEWNEDD